MSTPLLAARSHADATGHHTCHIAGEGWLCETCDDDFVAWILDHFGHAAEDFTHYPKGSAHG